MATGFVIDEMQKILFVVDGFEMVQSTSGPGGSTYESVRRFTLS